MFIETQNSLEKNQVLVSHSRGGGKFAFIAESNLHTIMVDEPRDMGGTETGFSPFDLLSASLASCVAITLRYYADRKNIHLSDFQVKVTHKFRMDPETKRQVLRLKCQLFFPEIEDVDLLEKLKNIAEKCPVHHALQEKIEIETHVVDVFK